MRTVDWRCTWTVPSGGGPEATEDVEMVWYRGAISGGPGVGRRWFDAG
jgi:hypothetical protein